MNLSTKQKQTNRQRTNLWLPRAWGLGEGKGLRVWGWQMQTMIQETKGQVTTTY